MQTLYGTNNEIRQHVSQVVNSPNKFFVFCSIRLLAVSYRTYKALSCPVWSLQILCLHETLASYYFFLGELRNFIDQVVGWGREYKKGHPYFKRHGKWSNRTKVLL